MFLAKFYFAGIVTAFAILGTIGAHASPPAPTYTGHYELANLHADQSFSLDVKQTGSKADLSFTAAMADGSGAAPDGDGKGQVNKAAAS